jgi:hypothetical protein
MTCVTEPYNRNNRTMYTADNRQGGDNGTVGSSGQLYKSDTRRQSPRSSHASTHIVGLRKERPVASKESIGDAGDENKTYTWEWARGYSKRNGLSEAGGLLTSIICP